LEAVARLTKAVIATPELLPRLAASGVFGIGVATADGGAGGGVVDGVEAVAAVSERSLAAGFVLWGAPQLHRISLAQP
jgi:hypothetical protein